MPTGNLLGKIHVEAQSLQWSTSLSKRNYQSGGRGDALKLITVIIAARIIWQVLAKCSVYIISFNSHRLLRSVLSSRSSQWRNRASERKWTALTSFYEAGWVSNFRSVCSWSSASHTLTLYLGNPQETSSYCVCSILDAHIVLFPIMNINSKCWCCSHQHKLLWYQAVSW